MANTINTLQNALGSLAVNGSNGINGTKSASPQKTGVESSAAGKLDQTSLSNVGGLVAQASAGSDVRTEKVAQLQAAIASGTYNVPASAVASKIVDSLLS